MSDSRRNAESPILARSLLTPLILWGLLRRPARPSVFSPRPALGSSAVQGRLASLVGQRVAVCQLLGHRAHRRLPLLAHLRRRVYPVGLPAPALRGDRVRPRQHRSLAVRVARHGPPTAARHGRLAGADRGRGPQRGAVPGAAPAGSVAGIWSGQSNAVVTALLILGLAAAL